MLNIGKLDLTATELFLIGPKSNVGVCYKNGSFLECIQLVDLDFYIIFVILANDLVLSMICWPRKSGKKLECVSLVSLVYKSKFISF